MTEFNLTKPSTLEDRFTRWTDVTSRWVKDPQRWIRILLWFIPEKEVLLPKDRRIYVYTELFGKVYDLHDTGSRRITLDEYYASFEKDK